MRNSELARCYSEWLSSVCKGCKTKSEVTHILNPDKELREILKNFAPYMNLRDYDHAKQIHEAS